ncbi:MAG: type II toxin-antitoxin system MqsA family antitoxin [Sterolibacterium sp.]
MASKWNGKTCPLCFEGTLKDGKQKQSLEYRGRSYEYTAKGAFCNHCHDGFPEHDAREEAAWVAFRDSVDAEEIAELARIRKKLKLTQQEAAKLAGGGKNAFSRYERGQAKPVAAVLNLFRLLDKHPQLLKELRAESV